MLCAPAWHRAVIMLSHGKGLMQAWLRTYWLCSATAAAAAAQASHQRGWFICLDTGKSLYVRPGLAHCAVSMVSPSRWGIACILWQGVCLAGKCKVEPALHALQL